MIQTIYPQIQLDYRTKSKNAQEAHEAIRPTDIKKTPIRLKLIYLPSNLNCMKLFGREVSPVK